MPEVVKEGRDVAVVGIDLIPEHLVTPRLQIARGEARLAGPRGTRDPADRATCHSVQPGKKPLARHHGADRRPRRLGECGLDFRHGSSIPPADLQMDYSTLPAEGHALPARVRPSAPAAGHPLDAVRATFHLQKPDVVPAPRQGGY